MFSLVRAIVGVLRRNADGLLMEAGGCWGRGRGRIRVGGGERKGEDGLLTVSSSPSLRRPFRLLCRKAFELPVLDIRILASLAFYEGRQQNVRLNLQ